jgi:Ca2+-binding RTX toxin-like protein
MRGGMGDDAYYVDNIGDKVTERAGEGTESVITTISFALRANVENMRLSGTAAINGTGNGLDNIIRGNAAANVLSGLDGDDTLVGGAGADRLIGGAGKDAFRFDVRETSANRDVIKDFVHGVDTIEFSRSVFKAFSGDPVGAVSASELAFGTAATTSSHHLIYNAANGALFYDADGVGGAAQVQIAVLTAKPALEAADIVLF